jgi:hypothetical protein
MGGAFALAATTVALVSPLIGLLLDRFPPRRIILPGILVFAIALATLSRLTPPYRSVLPDILCDRAGCKRNRTIRVHSHGPHLVHKPPRICSRLASHRKRC